MGFRPHSASQPLQRRAWQFNAFEWLLTAASPQWRLSSIWQIKQAFGCGVPNDAEWRPTTNARNKMMLKDMKDFAAQVRRMHGDVSQWRDSVGRK